jgi:hypothetical protein
MRVLVDFEWESIGRIEIDGGGSLRFPTTSAAPGIYRFSLLRHDKPAVYIGEADNLRRRMQHYRTPGPTQPTNRRLNNELRRAVASGASVEAFVATAARLELDGVEVPANLRHKAHRVLLEHAALVRAIQAGTDLVINLARESGP